VLDNSRAKRVIVISMMKSGTHVINELMVALGYQMYGTVRVGQDNRPALDRSARWRIATMVYGEEEAAYLKSQPEEAFNDLTDQAWEALAWAWQLRFGMPLRNLYSMELIDTGLVDSVFRRTAGSSFAETPAGICWVFHNFDIKQIDGAFLREWEETGEPRIIFNYRDPRDMTLSLVNFLCHRTKNGLSAPSFHPVFSRILLAKNSLDERLAYALTDTSFPCQPEDFNQLLWLLHHPRVCKVTFEELVGPEGGGSAQAQAAAVARLAGFVGETSRTAAEIAGGLFNADAFSFYKGQIGGWREVFTAEHRRLAEQRFGQVLPLFGYSLA
jgi:hypothetical protein